MSLRIALNGARGRMGQEIMELVKKNDGFYICATVDSKISEKNYESYVRLSQLSMQKPQVVIDFSTPKGTMDLTDWCVKNKCPIVIGTTGFNAQESKRIQAASKKIPVFQSANLSLGINAMLEAMKLYGEKAPCEVQIEEIHHKHKKDKPSGTALFLQKELAKNSKLKISEPVSLRGGEVFGIHKVYFFGQNEYVTFEHHAMNRKSFAEGALRVARWLVRKKPGIYSMQDYLNGEKK